MTGLRCEVVRTPTAWARAVALRLAVFVDEQGIPFDEELDAHDREACHLLATQDGAPVGTGRLVVEAGGGRIGRMAVTPPARGHGVGSAVLRALLDEARRRGLSSVHLAAQLHARPFYARFGFVASGDYFLDGGIWHQRMTMALGAVR